MSIFVRVIVLLLFGSMVSFFSSCNHDGEYDHSDITVIYSCSEDFLEFFTPVVVITNGDGSVRVISLSKNDFKKFSEPFTSSVNNSPGVEFAMYYSTITERIKGFKGVLNMTIKNVPTKVMTYENYEKYVFVDGISEYCIDVYCQDGHSIRQRNERYGVHNTSLNDFQNVIDPVQRFELMLHLLAHHAHTLDLTYNITASDDDIVFDGNCVLGIETIDHTNILK